ncbi:unnamed protein product [Ectocarpus sp. 6 AP-2014]
MHTRRYCQEVPWERCVRTVYSVIFKKGSAENTVSKEGRAYIGERIQSSVIFKGGVREKIQDSKREKGIHRRKDTEFRDIQGGVREKIQDSKREKGIHRRKDTEFRDIQGGAQRENALYFLAEGYSTKGGAKRGGLPR